MAQKISKALMAVVLATLSVGISETACAGLTIINFNDKKNTTTQSVQNSATNSNYNYVSYGSTYSSNGFTFQNSHIGNDAFLSWGTNSAFNADPNGASLAVNYGHTSTTINSNTGGIFNLKSLDLADIYNMHGEGGGGQVRFDFTTDSGTTSQIVNLATTAGLHTFIFNKHNLLSFSVTGIDTQGQGWLQMDNVKLFGQGIVSTVPEPATWLMMLGGFALAGFALQRREQIATRASV